MSASRSRRSRARTVRRGAACAVLASWLGAFPACGSSGASAEGDGGAPDVAAPPLPWPTRPACPPFAAAATDPRAALPVPVATTPRTPWGKRRTVKGISLTAKHVFWIVAQESDPPQYATSKIFRAPREGGTATMLAEDAADAVGAFTVIEDSVYWFTLSYLPGVVYWDIHALHRLDHASTCAEACPREQVAFDPLLRDTTSAFPIAPRRLLVNGRNRTVLDLSGAQPRITDLGAGPGEPGVLLNDRALTTAPRPGGTCGSELDALDLATLVSSKATDLPGIDGGCPGGGWASATDCTSLFFLRPGSFNATELARLDLATWRAGFEEVSKTPLVGPGATRPTMLADAAHLYVASEVGLHVLPIARPSDLATVYAGRVGSMALDDDAVVFSANDPARDDMGTIYRLPKR